MTRKAPHPLVIAAAAGFALLAAGPAAAQSCTTIGSSTFCGARGSHNTVGNTMIFNNGPAGQRLGNYAVTGTPPRALPRTGVIRGAERSPLAAPRTFSGVGNARRLSGQLGGSGGAYESRLAALRAEILALEAEERQRRLDRMDLSPAQKAAGQDMPPALVRALRLAQEAREKEAAEAAQ